MPATTHRAVPTDAVSDPSVLVEAAVDSVAAGVAAARAGAGRLELCADLAVGGTTPPAEWIRELRAATPLPIFAMVRPRAGDFVHSAAEQATCLGEAARLIQAGAHGIVTGMLTEAGRIDLPVLRRVVALAAPRPVTFHRAFDTIADQGAALEELVRAGVTRVLTSGGPGRAIEHATRLGTLVRQAGHRIVVMPGGGVRADHVAELVRLTGAAEVHLSAVAEGGLPSPGRVAAVVAALAATDTP